MADENLAIARVPQAGAWLENPLPGRQGGKVMGRSLEELLADTRSIRCMPEIFNIVAGAGSSQEAEEKAEEFEFPTPILREARLLRQLQLEHPQEFARIRKEIAANPRATPKERIFSCVYGDGFSENYGSVLVMPHPVLPPIFWDYTLLDEEGDIICAAQGEGKWKMVRLGDKVECVLAHGSRSLPASLKIRFKENCWGGITTEFVVVKKEVGCSPADDITFRWTRNLPRTQVSEANREQYARITERSSRGPSNENVTFQKLTKEEAKTLFEHCDRGEQWVLILQSFLTAPRDDARMTCGLKTIYSIPDYYQWRKCKAEESFLLEKVERVCLPNRTFASIFLSHSPIVEHLGLDRPVSRIACLVRDSLEEEIEDVAQKTPSKVDGLAALWYYFGFKSTHRERIYNLSSTVALEEKLKEWKLADRGEPLPLWKP